MQIGDTSSLSEYYALLRQQKMQQSSKTSSAAEALAGAAGQTEEQSGDFASLFAQMAGSGSGMSALSGVEGVESGTRPPPPPPPPSGAAGSGGSTESGSIPGDTDGDGELSAEELAALTEEMESNRSERPGGRPPPGNESASSFMEDRSSALSYAELLGGGASANASFSASSYMQSMLRSAYGA